MQQASDRLDKAATNAFNLIQEYADFQDPHSDQEDNPWRNPDAMHDELNIARSELMQAWQELSKQQQQQQQQPQHHQKRTKESEKDEKTQVEPEELRALYMDMITDAFADVLENMRQSQEQIDVDVLVDCLQSGMDMFQSEDRAGLFEALEDLEEEDGEEETPHELRRKELGYNVLVSS
jgi:hypothetical protein